MLRETKEIRLDLRSIERADWGWISEWFQDPWLNQHLGPMDLDWLDQVLTQREGVELGAFHGNKPVGLIGILWASSEHRYHAVTQLAGAPNLRGQGFGRLVLKQALAWPLHPPAPVWIAHVDKANQAPAKLLLLLGWTETGVAHGMRQFSSKH